MAINISYHHQQLQQLQLLLQQQRQARAQIQQQHLKLLQQGYVRVPHFDGYVCSCSKFESRQLIVFKTQERLMRTT